jgi:hypothetical protein
MKFARSSAATLTIWPPLLTSSSRSLENGGSGKEVGKKCRSFGYKVMEGI